MKTLETKKQSQHFGAMQPCSSGLGMTLEASDFRSVRRLVAYSSMLKVAKHPRKESIRESAKFTISPSYSSSSSS